MENSDINDKETDKHATVAETSDKSGPKTPKKTMKTSDESQEETSPEETSPEETSPEETSPEETSREETSPEETSPVVPSIDKSDQETSSHVCEICDKSFCNKQNLRKHIRRVHNQMHRKTCNICGKSCNDLETHMDKFHNKGRKICSLCGKTCNNLKNHVDNFHNKGQKTCNICGKSCNNLERHVNNFHNKERKTAPVVPSRDKSDQETSSHVCKICDKLFSKKQSLRKHLYQVHKMHRKTCNICGKSCNNLQNHVDKFHNKGRKTCNICGKSCNNLETHMDKFHNKGRKICNICGKSCNNLEKHLDKFHQKNRDLPKLLNDDDAQFENESSKGDKINLRETPVKPNDSENENLLQNEDENQKPGGKAFTSLLQYHL